MTMILENEVKYPLAHCTGYDVDDTLLFLRAMEMHMAEIVKDIDNKVITFPLTRTHIEHIYREYSSTVLDIDKVMNNMDYIEKAMTVILLLSL